jgi:hypothetical protein
MKTYFSGHLRRRRSRRSSSRRWARTATRRLRLEPLETRVLLSGVVGVRLEATDLSGNPITSVAVGSDFLVRGFVEDLRSDPSGVYAAYFDVSYDASRVMVSGTSSMDSPNTGRTEPTTQNGWHNANNGFDVKDRVRRWPSGREAASPCL